MVSLQAAGGTGRAGSLPVEPAVEEAIAWMVNLRSGEATETEHTDFARWYRAHPAHAAAWDRLQGSLRPLRAAADDRVLARGTSAREVLQRDVSRRRLLQTACFGGAAVFSTVTANRFVPLTDLLADKVTWTGERAELALDDGRLTLGPRSAVNLTNGALRDRLEVLAGEVLLTLSATRERPLDIVMGPWSLGPGAGRTTVRLRDDFMSVSALDRPLNVEIPGAAARVLSAGQTLSLDRGELRQEAADEAMETAWTDGLIVVRDRPLATVVRSVRPYFVGMIRMSPKAAGLRVGGVYRLDDPLGSFSAMAKTMPLQVRQLTPFWIDLDVRSA